MRDIQGSAVDEEEEEEWTSRISPSLYPKAHTINLLRNHSGAYYSVAGTFGRMVAASTRIFHAPLRQHAWEANEI